MLSPAFTLSSPTSLAFWLIRLLTMAASNPALITPVIGPAAATAAHATSPVTLTVCWPGPGALGPLTSPAAITASAACCSPILVAGHIQAPAHWATLA